MTVQNIEVVSPVYVTTRIKSLSDIKRHKGERLSKR
ncbi:hypothetical protein APL35_gp176 [Apis mellifera filamentous virus]|nr:hypothetical protein APL35_gp176 [Apis mellifera filamentous virus]